MGNSSQQQDALVIGIGNAYRGDDAAGLIAARRVREQGLKLCSVIEHTGEGTALMESWNGRDRVIVIDAMRSGSRPGTITRFDATIRSLPVSRFRNSTHAFSLAEAVEMSRALQQLPSQLIIYGVEAENVAAGTNISQAIEAALETVVERVLRELPGKPVR